MEVGYCRYNIDINHISCLFCELRDALKKLEENYSCSETITIDITDRNKTLYMHYLGYSGKRVVTIYKCKTIYDIEYLIYHSRNDRRKYLFDTFDSKRTLKCIEKLISFEES